MYKLHGHVAENAPVRVLTRALLLISTRRCKPSVGVDVARKAKGETNKRVFGYANTRTWLVLAEKELSSCFVHNFFHWREAKCRPSLHGSYCQLPNFSVRADSIRVLEIRVWKSDFEIRL